MQDPKDHADFLARHDYPVAAVAQLTEEQRHLLTRYGHWLEALAEGTIEPATADQQHFVRAVRGDVAPQSAFEIAWIEHRRALGAPAQEADLAAALAQVEAARLAVAAATDQYETRRAEILQRVQDELDALEVEFTAGVEPLRQASERAELAARTAVLSYGASFRFGRVQAIYTRGRVTWDTKGLTQYLESHPEVARYRRIGQPAVSFRLRPQEPPDARGPDFEE